MIKAKQLSICLYLLLVLSSVGSIENTHSSHVLNDSNNIDITRSDLSEINFENPTVQSTSVEYNETSPISIIGNAGFSGYPGDGTAENPYRIEGWNVTGSSTLISVQDTTAYFTINKNILSSQSSNPWGIRFNNVSNGAISNNIISEVGRAIYFESSDNNTISNNQIHDNNDYGLFLVTSDNNKISNNTIFNHSKSGISLWTGDRNDISNNTIFDNIWEGITFSPWFNNPNPSFNTVYNNRIYRNQANGIRFGDTTNNIVQNNQIFENNINGIELVYSSKDKIADNIVFHNNGSGIMLLSVIMSDISNNTISNNIQQGIHLSKATWIDGAIPSSYNTIENNLIYNNTGSGLDISNGGETNTVQDNQIYDNEGSGINIGDSSRSNTVQGNEVVNNGVGIEISNARDNSIIQNNVLDNGREHCGDGIGLNDAVNNSILANYISGTCDSGLLFVGNSDDNTVAENIVYDNGGAGFKIWDTSSGNVIHHNDFSSNPGTSNDDGQDNLIYSNYFDDWSDTLTYFISGSANNQDVSPQENPNHMASLSISIDNGDTQILTEIVTISWSSTVDTFHHTITYSISYSSDSGTSWTFLESGLTTLNFELDTTAIPEGSTILLRVEAIDEIGFTSTVISTGSYTIDNIDDTTSSFTTTLSSNDKESNGSPFVSYPILYLTVLPFGALYVVIRKKNQSS